MGYGLKTIGTTGLLQIDDGYVLHHAASQGIVASGGAVPSGTGILFVAPHTATGSVGGSPTSTNVFSSSSGSYSYVWMNTNPTPSASGYGLVIFNQNGTLAYDSSKKIMYPVLSYNYFEQPTGAYAVASKTISVPPTLAGRKRYVAAYPLAYPWALRINTYNYNLGYWVMNSVTINSSSVTIQTGALGGGPPGNAGPFGGMNFFFADFVT